MSNKKKHSPEHRNSVKEAQRNQKRRGGLMGIMDGLNKKEILSTFKQSGLIVAGFVGGRLIKKQFFKNDEAGLKQFIAPILLVGGGIVLSTQKNEYLKTLGWGVTASGLVEGVNTILKKDILNLDLKGFSLSGLLGGDAEIETISGRTKIPVYNEPIQLKLAPAYKPDLPDLNGDFSEKGDMGAVKLASEMEKGISGDEDFETGINGEDDTVL